MRDSLYEKIPYALPELKHFYGPDVHLLANPYQLSLLASLCAKDTQQPQVNTLVRTLYSELITTVINNEFPRRQAISQGCAQIREQTPTRGFGPAAIRYARSKSPSAIAVTYFPETVPIGQADWHLSARR